jgi:hypothetical protein
LEDAAGDRAGFGDGDLDGVKQCSTVLGTSLPLGAYAAQVRAQCAAAAARDDEMRSVMHVVVEQECVRAADGLDVVTPHEIEERPLADAEAALRVRRVAPVEVRRDVHEHDPVRFGGGFQAVSEKGEKRVWP